MSYVTNGPMEANLRRPPFGERFPKVYILPKTVYMTFVAKHGLSELHCYKTLRGVLPIEDIARIEVLGAYIASWLQGVPFGTSYLYNNGPNPWLQYETNGEPQSLIRTFSVSDPMPQINDRITKDEGELNEITHTVLPLSRSPAFINETVQHFLAKTKNREESVIDSVRNFNGNALDDPSSIENTYTGKAPDPTAVHGIEILLQQDSIYIVVEEGFLSLLKNPVPTLAFMRLVLKAAYSVSPIRIVNRSYWYQKYVAALKA